MEGNSQVQGKKYRTRSPGGAARTFGLTRSDSGGRVPVGRPRGTDAVKGDVGK